MKFTPTLITDEVYLLINGEGFATAANLLADVVFHRSTKSYLLSA